MFLREIKDINYELIIEFEHEVFNKEEETVEYIDALCEVTVVVIQDPKGTGDSPVSYDVDIHKAYTKDDNKPIKIEDIPKNTIEFIKDTAIEVVNK